MDKHHIRKTLALRFSRNSYDQERKWKRDKRLAQLEAEAWREIARGRDANIRLGRVFRQIKKKVGHGNWLSYYAKRFGSSGIPERTARTYMKMAREEHSPKTKSADSAVLEQPVKSAVNQAAAVTEADRRAKIENEQARPAIYKLPLHLSPEEQVAATKLCKSQQWLEAEGQIVALLKQLCVELGEKGSEQ